MRPELAAHDLCTGCSACFAACGRRAVRMRPDAEGFLRPEVDEATCTACGACSRACPVLRPVPDYAKPLSCLVARRLPLSRRRESASGGAFAALAEQVIAQGGVVYGAAFDGADWTVRHVRAADAAGLARLQGSKYVQSAMGDAYRQVRDDLRDERHVSKVLFSGTPCQVAGLKAFLGRADDRLLLAEVVCNSVPSPAWWRACVAVLSSKRRGPAEKVAMRAEGGGRPFLLQVTYGRKTLSFRFLTQLYAMVWMGGWACRPSCLRCGAKGRSGADLSFGDAWGVQALAPWKDDGGGVSEIICWSEKGRQAVVDACARLEASEVPFDRVLTGNCRIRESLEVKAPADRFRKGREALFRAIARRPESGLSVAKRLTKTHLHQRAVRFLLKRLSRVFGKVFCHG